MKKLFLAITGDGFMPSCSYCAAMRYTLISATLTGFIFGCGLQRITVYTLLGAWIGVVQVVFLFFHYKATQE